MRILRRVVLILFAAVISILFDGSAKGERIGD